MIGRTQRLRRDNWETDGRAIFRTYVEERVVSVTAALDRSNCDHAIQTHKSIAGVVMTGDLERFGSR